MLEMIKEKILSVELRIFGDMGFFVAEAGLEPATSGL